MNEQELQYREARLMEPIYRMFKVLEQQDLLKAQTLMAVVTQYITDHYSGKPLTPADVQGVIRAVLLHEEDGQYYAMYILNEIQVKVAGWLTLLAVDRPIVLGELGTMVEQLASDLQGKNCIKLSAEDVLTSLKEIVAEKDDVLLERVTLNQENYLSELKTFLVQQTSNKQ